MRAGKRKKELVNSEKIAQVGERGKFGHGNQSLNGDFKVERSQVRPFRPATLSPDLSFSAGEKGTEVIFVSLFFPPQILSPLIRIFRETRI